MNNKYKNTNHSKHLLQFYAIFVTKFILWYNIFHRKYKH